MKISKNFLSNYVKIDCSIEELCDKLTCAGIEVEEVAKNEIVPNGIIVGKILERKAHENAESLSVCKVFDGTNEIQIVCGAPNCDAGKTIALATVGTTFVTEEGEFKIKKAKLRGVESCGMMCSEKELNISDNHDGLMELDSSLKAGTSINDVLGADTCITVEVTPNRPDWLSHYGIARDVACLFHSQAQMPEIKLPEVKNPKDFPNLVTIENFDLCPRYTARVIENVTVKESPKWLKDYLTAIGLRPINNIVDISNFVLMELGQPLHVFDMDKLAGKRVVARNAKKGEKIELLDGKVIELKEEHLVIADAEKPVVLAGIMGGIDSGVTFETKNVLIESAIFFSSNIRSSSRALGISSDSSYRYERGVDYDMAESASARAAQLILDLAGGELASNFIDVQNGRPEEKVISCRFEKIRTLLGIEITNEEIAGILERLQLKVSEMNATSCQVTVPLFRLDLQNEADLAEEVARINGLDKLPTLPVMGKVVNSIREDAYEQYRLIRNQLIGLGLHECVHYSTVSDKSALSDSRFEMKDVVRLSNPLSLDLACLRPSLLGEMLNTLERNISRRNLDLPLFEIGKVFCANAELYPEERMELAIMVTGRKHPERFSNELNEYFDFYDLKGKVEALLIERKVPNYRFVKSEDKRFKNSSCAELIINGKSAGFLGEIADNLTAGFKTTYTIFGAIIDIDLIIKASRDVVLYKPFNIFPATTRDVAFTADLELENGTVLDCIRKMKLDNLEKVELFDIFVDEKLGKNKKSMAYSFTFRHAERTLTDNEVNKTYEILRKKLAMNLNIELR